MGDIYDEAARLRHKLRLAEKGLANATQELHCIQQASLTWAMVCDCNCKACQELHNTIRDAQPHKEQS